MMRGSRWILPLAPLFVVLVGAQAQAQRPHPLPPSSALGGAGLFIAPSLAAGTARIRVAGELDVTAGASESMLGRAAVGLALPPPLLLSVAWEESLHSAGEAGRRERTFALGVEGRRGGIAIGRRRAAARLENYESDAAGVDVRAWVDGAIAVGMNLRTTRIEERGGPTWQRIYNVAGYDFISTRKARYLLSDRHTDIELDVGRSIGPLRLTAVAGWGTSEGPAPDRVWGYGRIAAPVRPGLEVVLEGGRNGGVPAIGRAPGAFGRLGFRVDLTAARKAAEPWPADAVAMPRDRPVAAELRSADDGTVLRVHAPDATTVELKGDFTEWRVRPMTPVANGAWEARLDPGVHRFNIRIDGSAWFVPAGVPALPDEFSGALVAVVVIPSG